MAVFNPQVAPTQDPNYFRYSQPISGVEGDKSTGLMLAGAATDLESGAELAKTTAHDIINKDVRDTVEPVRQEFTSTLEAARNSIIPAPVQTPDGTAVDQPVPDAVKSGIKQVGSLQDAMVNGKVNDTWYHGELSKKVVALRQRYPGFLDYIDQEVSKITGVVPANAYVADLMQDINRATSNKKTEADKILDLARGAISSGFDGATQKYERLRADPSFEPEFLRWYNEENAKDTRIRRDDAARNNRKGTREELAIDDRQKMNSFVSDTIDSRLNSVLTLSGTNKPETVMDILTRAKNDPKAFPEDQMEEFATKLQAERSILKSQITSLIQKKGYSKSISQADIDTDVEKQLQVYDAMYDAVRKGGSSGAGLAFYHANIARARFDQSNYNFTTGPDGEYFNNIKIIQNALGPGLSGALIPRLAIASGLPDRLQARFAQDVMAGRAQPDPKKPTTATEQMAAAAADKRIAPYERAALLDNYVKVANDFKNKDISDEVLQNDVKYLFSPGNNGMLQHFNMDYTERDANGRLKVVHPGKNAVWTGLTETDNTDRIAKLDGASKTMYRNWVVNTGREVIGEDVKNLNHFTGHDNLYFEWNGKDRQLVLKDKEGALEPIVGTTTTRRPPPDSYIWQVKSSVDRINKAITNLSHVYDSFGGNTEAQLLETLQQYGLRNPDGKITGLPKAMGDAIANSHPSNKPKPGGD